MSDTPQIPPEDPAQDDDFLAAEMALGLTTGDALQAAQGRLNRDAPFAAKVAGWQERFVALTDDIKPVSPRKRAKKDLLVRLFPKVRVPLTQRLWVWKGISLAAVLALAYIAMPMLRPAPDTMPAQIYAAQMSGESTLEVLAVVDTARGDIALRRLVGGAPDGRVLELWAILPDQAPISLGVLPAGDVTRVALPDEMLGQVATITFAISDEPTGGAPDGTPTGSILATGIVSAL
ncbi:MAG: anti-sigma factor [Sulfitobacter sp.]